MTTRPKSLDTVFLQQDGHEEEEEAQRFDSLYQSIGELMRKYQEANGALSEACSPNFRNGEQSYR